MRYEAAGSCLKPTEKLEEVIHKVEGKVVQIGVEMPEELSKGDSPIVQKDICTDTNRYAGSRPTADRYAITFQQTRAN